MAPTLWNFVVMLFIVAIGVQAQPTSNRKDLLVRQSTTYVPNGDFSAPLKGTWTVKTTGGLPRNYVHRIEIGGNDYVVQVDQLKSCSNSDPVDGSRLELGGSVVNVVAQQEFTISFQYRLAESTDFYSLGIAMDNALSTDKSSFTKKVKANHWYSFTQSFKMEHRFTGQSTAMTIVFVTCGDSASRYPTFQLDNVVVTT